jgi:hypothetical protein
VGQAAGVDLAPGGPAWAQFATGVGAAAAAEAGLRPDQLDVAFLGAGNAGPPNCGPGAKQCEMWCL